MNKDLITLKSQRILELQDAKRRNARRDILEFASQAAVLEGRIVQALMLENRFDEALINLSSQSSCFHDASRFTEERRILEFANELAPKGKLAKWIQNRLSSLEAKYPIPSRAFAQSAHITGNPKLRRPQEEAYNAATEYFSTKEAEHAIIQLPVGCGKTGTIAILPFGVAKGRMLVVAPNIIIRDNLIKNLDATRQDSFLRKAAVIDSGVVPACAILDENANVQDCDEAAIVVTNIQQLVSRGRSKWLSKLAPDFFDLIVLDEGHHNVAPTWQDSLAHFPRAKVTSFTATPFRADGKRVSGTRIYKFPVADAIREGYVKDIASHRIEPREITFTYKGESSTHSLEEVMRLKDEDWFSKGVALSPECNRGIVDHSITCMERLRGEGTIKHCIIAAACSIDHARAIRAMYAERNLTADVIHSDLPEEEKVSILSRLDAGNIDVIVQVQMLGEGADFPKLSVAAIFRPYRHLVPYVQFVGRVMRVVKQEKPGDTDNRGFVVSHVGLNVERWWKELRDLDGDDQQFFEELAKSEREFLLERSSGPDEPTSRQRFVPEMVVLEETIARFVQDRFLPEDVQAMVDDLVKALGLRGVDIAALGLSRDDLVMKIRMSNPTSSQEGQVVEQPVQPQRTRQLARERLDERVRSGAKQLLNELSMTVVGRELPRAFPQTGTSNNISAAIVLLNLEVRNYLSLGSNERDIALTEQMVDAHDHMDQLIDTVAKKVRTKRASSNV